MRVVIIAPFMQQGQEVLAALRALRPDVNYSVATMRDHIRGVLPNVFIMCQGYGVSSARYDGLLDEMRLVAYRREIPVINALQAHHQWLGYSVQAKQSGEEQTE